MCRSCEELLARRNLFPSLSLIAAGTVVQQERQLNRVLIQALADAVGAITPEAQTRMEQTLLAEHGLRDRETNLLTSTYSDTACAGSDHSWWNNAAYLQAREPESRFHVICDSASNISLRLVCRLRHEPFEQQLVTVEVNGHVIEMLAASTRWAEYTLSISADHLRTGWNSLAFHWPEPDQPHRERLAEVIEQLESQGGTSKAACRAAPLPTGAKLYPVYGEIHALYAVSDPTGLESVHR